MTSTAKELEIMWLRNLSCCRFVIAPLAGFKHLLKSPGKVRTALSTQLFRLSYDQLLIACGQRLRLEQQKEFIYSIPLSGHKEPELLS
jgi:hypothetical protein